MTLMTFKLNSEEQIVVQSEYKINEILCCNEGLIFFKNKNNQKMMLRNDSLREALAVFVETLGEAIVGKLKLHISIIDDIGYMWNKSLNEDSDLIYNGNGFWVGQANLLWSISGYDYSKVTTWLYNDVNDNIVLEVTPTYKWHFQDPEPGDALYTTYEEFMQKYKPILLRIIPEQIAVQWLKQAQDLLNKIEANTTAAKAECGD